MWWKICLQGGAGNPPFSFRGGQAEVMDQYVHPAWISYYTQVVHGMIRLCHGGRQASLWTTPTLLKTRRRHCCCLTTPRRSMMDGVHKHKHPVESRVAGPLFCAAHNTQSSTSHVEACFVGSRLIIACLHAYDFQKTERPILISSSRGSCRGVDDMILNLNACPDTM